MHGGGAWDWLNKKIPQNNPIPTSELPEIDILKFPCGRYGRDRDRLIEVGITREHYVSIRNKARYWPGQIDPELYCQQHPVIDNIFQILMSSRLETSLGGPAKDYQRVMQFMARNLRCAQDRPRFRFLPQLGYLKDPIEFLVQGEGDCEDFTGMASSLLRTSRRGLGLLFFKNHVALAVALRENEAPPRRGLGYVSTLKIGSERYFGLDAVSRDPQPYLPDPSKDLLDFKRIN